MSASFRLGDKGGGPDYDPQMGAAAAAQAEVARDTLNFNREYFTTYVAPLIGEMTASSAHARDLADQQWAQQQEMYRDNKMRADFQWDRYLKWGVPAEDAYYNMVKEYSAPEEEEKQANLALGDVRTAAAGAQKSTERRLQSVGIDLTSPAAIAAFSDNALLTAAAESGAANRARQGAKELGMKLKMDAANFGRGGQSSVLAFGSAASGNVQAGFGGAMQAAGITNQAAGIAPGAVSGINQGFGIASNAYGQQFQGYAGLQGQSMQMQAQNNAGFGQFLGTVAGAAITKWSDIRLKKNIVPVGETPSGLKLYTFDYVWESHGRGRELNRVGVIAQEVQEIQPEAVIVDRVGFLTVDYNALR